MIEATVGFVSGMAGLVFVLLGILALLAIAWEAIVFKGRK